MMTYRVVSVWGTTGSCGPEQIYGQDEPPEFETLAEAEASAAELLPGAREVAPGCRFVIEEISGRDPE